MEDTALREAIKKELKPLLIGLRNEIKSNPTLKKLEDISAVLVAIKDNKFNFFKGEKGDFVKGEKGDRGLQGVQGKSIKGDKGDRGTDGHTPVFGKDFWTKKEQTDFASDILKQATPIKGVHYKDGEKGAKGDRGTDGTEIKAIEVRDKLESLKGKAKLKMKAIYGLEEALQKAMTSGGSSSIGGSGGSSTGTVDLSAYSTKAQADLLYKPIGYTPDLSAYSTKSVADTLYKPIGYAPDLSGYARVLRGTFTVANLNSVAVANENNYTYNTTHVKVTKRWGIRSVTGVWINSGHTGTNYYTGGSYDANSGVITLGTPVAGATTSVYIAYSYNLGTLTITHGWALAAPYTVRVTIFDDTFRSVSPVCIGSANSVDVDLNEAGILSGTWGYLLEG